MEIFTDESGDLGFSSRSSQNFVAAYVIPERPDVASKKAVKPEFKFSRDSERVKQKVFKELSMQPIEIGLVVVDKSAVNTP